MRKLLVSYAKSFPNAKEVRAKLVRVSTLREGIAAIESC